MASDGKEGTAHGTAALALGGVVVAVAGMLIVPLPTWLISALITLNLGLSVTLLLAAGYARSLLSVGTFPTLLVLTTLFRLALNVSTVRLILLQADAGEVVRAFGSFVVRGDYVVGGAVFLILTIVQYVVIARGAERVAEVAARFTLDAMPGRQLAIDADLRARAIEPGEARRRRAALQREAQLYGSLDGAMRFVKGDAIAAIAILGIALVGGLAIGTLRHGMSIGAAAELYTLLTIGDGLASQIPALLIATAAGLLVTRVSSDDGDAPLGVEVVRQFFSRPVLLGAVAGLLALLGLVGLPLVPFAFAALVFAAGALLLSLRRSKEGPDATAGTTTIVPSPGRALELVLPREHAGLPGLRAAIDRELRALADDLGLSVPPVALRSEAAGAPAQLRVHGLAVAIDPLPNGGGDAEAIAAALARALRRVAPSLIGLDEAERMVEALSARCPALCREVVPRRLELPALAELLRRLLAEGVPIGDLREILEAVASGPAPDPALDGAGAAAARDPAALVERVRRRMAPRLSARLAPHGQLRALLLDPMIEDVARESSRPGQLALALEPALAEDIVASLGSALVRSSLGRTAGTRDSATPPTVLLVAGDLRPQLAHLLSTSHPELPVVAYEELTSEVEIVEVGHVGPGGPGGPDGPSGPGGHSASPGERAPARA